MEVGNKIYELRKKQGFSQEDLAKMVNVTRQTISNWELNQTAPDIVQAKKLAQIFQMSLDELVDNNIQNVIVEKINYVKEKNEQIIKICKIIGIIIIICLSILIIAISFLAVKSKVVSESVNQIILNETKIKYKINETKIKFSLNNHEYLYTFSYLETINGNCFAPSITLNEIIGESETIENNDFLFYFNNYEIQKEYWQKPKEVLENLKKHFTEKGATYEIVEEKSYENEDLYM